jgi:hypothetical protein
MALKRAEPNPLMVKPTIVTEVSQSMNPLITKVKSPSDRTLRGSVIRIKIGLITAFTTPRNIDPIIIPHKEGSKPGIKSAVIKIAKIFNSQRATQPCIADSPFQ